MADDTVVDPYEDPSAGFQSSSDLPPVVGTPDQGVVYPSSGFDFSKVDWGGMLSKYGPAAVGSFLGASGILNSTPQKSGYQGGIPKYTATRQQIPIDSTVSRRPGGAGRRYFTDMAYVPKTGIATPAAPVAPVEPAVVPVAQGGMIGYAQGGLADLGYYLGGTTDGMADKIDTTIDKKQPASLSHGEFIVPADCVSALGSGNSSAGAKVLYEMMDRIRKNAHGTTKQIKQANLKKTLPA